MCGFTYNNIMNMEKFCKERGIKFIPLTDYRNQSNWREVVTLRRILKPEFDYLCPLWKVGTFVHLSLIHGT